MAGTIALCATCGKAIYDPGIKQRWWLHFQRQTAHRARPKPGVCDGYVNRSGEWVRGAE
jgi:hypothetical protein